MMKTSFVLMLLLAAAVSQAVELTFTDASSGDILGRLQSHITIKVPYKYRSGKQSSASIPVTKFSETSTTDVEKDSFTAVVEWKLKENDTDVAKLFLNFTRDADGSVTLGQAKANIPKTEEFNFSEAAEDYGAPMIVEFPIDREVSAPKQSYFCSANVSFTDADSGATLNMTRTQIIAFGDKFSTDRDQQIICSEDMHTTTTAPVTTTMEPASAGQWNITDGNSTCVMFRAAITLQLTWEQEGDNKSSHNVTGSYPVPAHEITMDQAKSTCNESGSGDQLLVLHFWDTWMLYLTFSESSGAFNLSAVKLHYNLKATPVASVFVDPVIGKTEGDHTGYTNGPVTAKTTQSYKCAKGVTKLTVDDEFALSLAQLQAQAGPSDGQSWNPPQLCDADVVSSDLVPIIVGSCLAALVVIVLVAYLIGRARAQRQGYSSV